MVSTKSTVKATHALSLVLDTDSLYAEAKKRFGVQAKVDFQKMSDVIAASGWRITHKVAFATAPCQRNTGFDYRMRKAGYKPVFGSSNPLYDLAIEVCSLAQVVDRICIASADPRIESVLQWCRKYHSKPLVFACNIPTHFRQYAEVWEIQKHHLMEFDETNNTTKQLVLSADSTGDCTGQTVIPHIG